MSEKDKGAEQEPDWLDPANDRKTPYTDEEIEIFVEGFILGLDEPEWSSMKSELGEAKARKKIRAGIIRMDDKNPINLSTKGTTH
jgi:hypothetical protein